MTSHEGVLMWQKQGDVGSRTPDFSLYAAQAGHAEVSINVLTVHFDDDSQEEGISTSASVDIGGGSSQPDEITLTINPSTIEVGNTAQASIEPADDSVRYTSDNQCVTIDEVTGNILGVSEGEATITATTGSGAVDTKTITVTPNSQPPVDEFTVNPSNLSLTVGGAAGNVQVSGGTVGSVTSSNDQVATAVQYSDSIVLVQAVAAGDATITIGKAGSDTTATVHVTVSDGGSGDEKPIPQLNPTSVTLNAGGESASITSDIPVTWTSSNSNVVAVAANSSDTQAAIISNNAGTAVITATAEDGGKTATVSVTVKANDEQAAPTITPSSNIKMEVGKSVFLSANQSVTWSSSNSTVATIDGDGLVIAKSAGETTITAKNKSGKSSSIKVTVVQASSNGGSSGSGTVDPNGNVDPNSGTETTSTFAISPTKTQTLDIGATLQIKVTKGTAASWKSSKPAVATVDNNGKVTANAAGTTIITAVASDGSVAQVKVRVRDANGEVPDPGSESNTDVPSTGEASTELLLVLGVLTCIIAMFIFRKKTK